MSSLQLVGDEPRDNKRLLRMLNDADDKHLDPEEGEYHFSDEDINYEVEAESPGASGGAMGGLFAKASKYRRVFISLFVFVMLVVVVYKMVSPGSDVPATDILPMAAPQAPAQVPAPVQQRAAAPARPAPAQPVAEPAPVVDMPSVIPVVPSEQIQPRASQPPSQPVLQQQAPLDQAIPTVSRSPQVSNGMDSAVAAMAATNEKLMVQLQAEYSQRVNEYVAQNKALQNQVQTLSARVASMEGEMQSMVKKLTEQKTAAPAPVIPPPAQVTPVVPKVLPVVENKSGFTVQAIIPGRAWLRAENGETLTVTEGDKIKGLGKVSRIDPYDGVVEVNTGSKIISISYGNND